MLSIKEKASRGEPVFGTFLFEFFEAGVPLMIKQAGGEFVVLDQEHSGAGLDRLKPLVLISRAVGVCPIVRVADSRTSSIAGALDIGAQGIMIPMVETAEQMQAIVRAAKYYPEGARGCAFGIAHDDYVDGASEEKLRRLNDGILLLPLIESAKGAENADAIAALDGVDVLWIGHLDLSASLGVPGQYGHPLFREALERIFAAGRKYGKPCGNLIPEAADLARWYDGGTRFFSLSADLWLFRNALRQGIADARLAAGKLSDEGRGGAV